MKDLIKTLFRTFIFSTIIDIAATCIYYVIAKKGSNIDYGQAVSSIISGALFLNLILALMSLPMLFLGHDRFWANKSLRLVLSFSGSIVFLFVALSGPEEGPNKVFYLLTWLIFVIVHAFNYYKLIKTSKLS